jgi:hypothetical protein
VSPDPLARGDDSAGDHAGAESGLKARSWSWIKKTLFGASKDVPWRIFFLRTVAADLAMLVCVAGLLKLTSLTVDVMNLSTTDKAQWELFKVELDQVAYWVLFVLAVGSFLKESWDRWHK